MIVCSNCGKVTGFKIKENVTREVIFDRNGIFCNYEFVSERRGKPRCSKCGRLVKFVKDEESEDR
jgi:hypothetical protein